MVKYARLSIGWIIGASFAISIYWIPRFLSEQLGESSPWISYLYTYIIGGLFFLLTSFVIFSTDESKNPLKKIQDRNWLKVLVCMLLWGTLIHGLWILIAVQYPFKG